MTQIFSEKEYVDCIANFPFYNVIYISSNLAKLKMHQVSQNKDVAFRQKG